MTATRIDRGSTDTTTVYSEGGDPRQIVEQRGMRQVTDTGAIEAAVDQVIAENPAQVEKARANPKLAGWFVGLALLAALVTGVLSLTWFSRLP